MKATPWNLSTSTCARVRPTLTPRKLDHQSWQVLPVPQQLPHPRAHPAEHHENHRSPQCGGHPKVERLLWRGTILLLRLFGDFPPVFLFGSKISAHSTKPAPPFLNLSVRTAQPCSSPAPPARFLTSTPKPRARSAGHLWRSAAPVSAPASVGAGLSPLGSSTPAGSRDQVLLPLPK